MFASWASTSFAQCGLSTDECTGAIKEDVVGVTERYAADPSPFYAHFSDQKVQYLIQNTELMAAGIRSGLIHDLSIYVQSKISSIPYTDFTISMGCTPVGTLEVSWGFLTGMQQVYHGDHTTAIGWNTFVFDTAFAWDESQNLIIEICYNNSTTNIYDIVSTTLTPFNSTLYQRANSGSGCTYDDAEYSMMERPVFRFTNCESKEPDTSGTGITELNINEIDIFPNPAYSYIEVNLNDGYDYTIIDLQGRIVSEGILEGSRIELEDLAQGMYIVKFFNDKEQFMSRLVKL